MNIVLFDADGVVQHPSAERRNAFEKILGLTQASSADAFLEDLFAAKSPH